MNKVQMVPDVEELEEKIVNGVWISIQFVQKEKMIKPKLHTSVWDKKEVENIYNNLDINIEDKIDYGEGQYIGVKIVLKKINNGYLIN